MVLKKIKKLTFPLEKHLKNSNIAKRGKKSDSISYKSEDILPSLMNSTNLIFINTYFPNFCIPLSLIFAFNYNYSSFQLITPGLVGLRLSSLKFNT